MDLAASFIYTQKITNNNCDRDDRLKKKILTQLASAVDRGVAISYQSLSPQEVVAYSCTLVWKQFTHVQRRDSSGKLVPTLRRCISVTHDIKINEQDKSIGIRPLYL